MVSNDVSSYFAGLWVRRMRRTGRTSRLQPVVQRIRLCQSASDRQRGVVLQTLGLAAIGVALGMAGSRAFEPAGEPVVWDHDRRSDDIHRGGRAADRGGGDGWVYSRLESIQDRSDGGIAAGLRAANAGWAGGRHCALSWTCTRRKWGREGRAPGRRRAIFACRRFTKRGFSPAPATARPPFLASANAEAREVGLKPRHQVGGNILVARVPGSGRVVSGLPRCRRAAERLWRGRFQGEPGLTLLDTNVMIHYQKGIPEIVARIQSASRAELAIPAIVVYELE